MAKLWRIGGREIAAAGEVPPATKAVIGWRLPSAGMLATDVSACIDALALYRHLGGFLGANPDIQKRDVQSRVFERINKALLTGEIVAFQREALGGSTKSGGGTSTQQLSQPKPPGSQSSSNGPPPAKTTDKTWVDVQLLDEDGDPVAGERYVLKITDGSTREGTLGDDGRVRVNGIEPGTCVVTFPDIDTKEWWRKS